MSSGAPARALFFLACSGGIIPHVSGGGRAGRPLDTRTGQAGLERGGGVVDWLRSIGANGERV